MTDATIQLYGGLVLFGWLAGFAFALAVWWRPITKARTTREELRLARRHLEDSDRALTDAHAQATRMAVMLAEIEGRR
jgi:hypothetical protein